MLKLENGILQIETATLLATMQNGMLTSLRSKETGKNYICADASNQVGSHVVFQGGEHRALDTGSCETRLLSDRRAQVVYHSWYGDGVTNISIDEATGDLLVEPNASSGRTGVKAVGWKVDGIDESLYAVLPANQGVRLKLDDPILAGSMFEWPCGWEIGMCVFENDEKDGFWVHCRDRKYTYKDIVFGKDETAHSVGFLTEAYGPLDNNTSAGGLVWRINCFTGGWRVPATIYRNWYYAAYDLENDRQNRQPWLKDIKMGISWVGDDVSYLETLAKVVDPSKVLIHLAHWRDFGYDQDYPEYDPSAKAAAYFKRGEELGFHIAPHLNSMEIDPSHPVYPMLSQFQMRHTDTKTVYGWGFDGPSWQYLGVPWTEFAKTDPRNRRYNIMTKIHTGSTLWHTVLYERMEKLAKEHPVAGCFIDVTLCTYNLHNCLVDGRTSTEGLNDLIHLLSEIRGGLPIGGEGLNEITAQGLSFAQMHLYKSGHHSIPGLERTAGDCAINDFIYGDLCRVIGYHGLSGRTEDEVMRHGVYMDHNAIPTITHVSEEELLDPNPTVKSILEQAR